MSEATRGSITAKILPVICLAIFCGILVACLWPFHSPKNEVTWLGDENGLRFGQHGTILSSGTFKIASSQDQPSCSIEIWLQPGLTHDSNTFLAFYTPQNPLQFSLHQSDVDLVLQRATGDQQHQSQTAEFHIDDVFHDGKPVFITITSGQRGTAIYIDGVLAKASGIFPLSIGEFTGQLVVGDSPVGPDSWSGKLLGLAIYNLELTATQVGQHYDNWTKKGRPDHAPIEGSVAVYLFDEHTGRVVHNHVSSGVDLAVPERYVIVDQVLLEPPWEEFYIGWSYWKNVVINIVGFIPMGYFFYIYMSSVRKVKRATLATIIMGCALSLTVETLQAYLPTRQSGLTDVITNTLGTCLGVALATRYTVAKSLHRASPKPSSFRETS